MPTNGTPAPAHYGNPFVRYDFLDAVEAANWVGYGAPGGGRSP